MRKPRTVDKEKEEYWRRVFAQFQASGLPFKKFCVQENISANTFQYWRRELRHRDEVRGVTSTISKGDNRPSNLQQKIDYWLRIIDEINAHDGSVNSYCRSHGVASGSLHFWERRLREMKLTNGVRRDRPNGHSSSGLFAPVQVLDDIVVPDEDSAHSSTDHNKEVVLPVQTQRQLAAELIEPRTGYRVRVFNGADRSTLSALIASLSSCQSSGF